MKVETFHFKEASRSVTSEVIALVKKFLEENPKIEHIIVATTEGATGVAVVRNVPLAARQTPDQK